MASTPDGPEPDSDGDDSEKPASPMSIASNLAAIRRRIERACTRVGRPSHEVRLIAVSKFKPPEMIREAYAAGQRDFGENYVQELLQKREQLSDLSQLRWHLIGHLQTKKARQIAACVSEVHTVDTEKLARELSRRAELAGARIRVYVEVNLAAEDQKAGCTPAELQSLVDIVHDCAGLELVGLMAIPPATGAPEQTRSYFAQLRQLGIAHHVPRLSMGMSGDFECAIEEGSTDVRVGTAIFGART